VTTNCKASIFGRQTGRAFEQNGGFNERLYKVRTEARKQQLGKGEGKMDGIDHRSA